MKRIIFRSYKFSYSKNVFTKENYKELIEEWKNINVPTILIGDKKIIVTDVMKTTFEKIREKIHKKSSYENIFYLVGEENLGKTTLLELYSDFGKLLGWKVFFMKNTQKWIKKSSEEASKHYLDELKPFLIENELLNTPITNQRFKSNGLTIEKVLTNASEKKITARKAVYTIFDAMSQMDVPFLFIYDDYDHLLYANNEIDEFRSLHTIYPYAETTGSTEFKKAVYIIGLSFFAKAKNLLPAKIDNIIYIGTIKEHELDPILETFPEKYRNTLKTIESNFLIDYVFFSKLIEEGVKDVRSKYDNYKSQEFKNILKTLISEKTNEEWNNILGDFADYLFGFKKISGQLSNLILGGLGFKNEKGNILFKGKYAFSGLMDEFKRKLDEFRFIEFSFRYNDLYNIMISPEKDPKHLLREIGSCLINSKNQQFDIDLLALDGVTLDSLFISTVINNVIIDTNNEIKKEVLIIKDESLIVPDLKLIFKVIPTNLLNVEMNDENIKNFMKDHPDYTLIYLSFKKSKDVILMEFKQITKLLPEYTNRIWLSFQEDYIQNYPIVKQFYDDLEKIKKEVNEFKDEDDWSSVEGISEVAEKLGDKEFRGLSDSMGLLKAQRKKFK